MNEEQRNQLLSQVITDTDELEDIGAQINDPYQTLVSHTTCASCHRCGRATRRGAPRVEEIEGCG